MGPRIEWFGYNFGEIPSDIPAGVPSHHTYSRAGSQCGSERQHSGAMDAIPDVVKYISLFIGGTRLLPLISLSTKNINGYLRLRGKQGNVKRPAIAVCLPSFPYG